MPVIAIVIMAASAVIIFIVYRAQQAALYRSYEEIKADAAQIKVLINGEIERDDNDLQITGNYGRLPTIIRFATRQDAPGMSIEMTVPATFDLAISPKGLQDTKGRAAIRTGSLALDSRFSARSNQPMQAKVFLDNIKAREQLEKLCCSNQTGVVIETASLELHELLIPSNTAGHVREHLESMNAVAGLLEKMPGAGAITITPLAKEGNWLFRAVVAVGVIVIFVTLFTQNITGPSTLSSRLASPVPEGILPADAGRISQLDQWTVVRDSDLSPAVAQYLHDRGQTMTGRVAGHFGSVPGEIDSAYLLRDAQGRSRVTMIAGKSVIYDAIFPKVDLIAVVPHDSLPGIQWQIEPRAAPEGDALLLVQDVSDPLSGQVLFQQGRQIFTGRPADFTKINL